MTPRALVTGATGMLGSYIVRELVQQGWRVRALVRDPQGARWLTDMGATLAAGSLGDRSSIVAAARDCTVVFHAAAEIGSATDPEAFRRANVDGTENVVEAAAIQCARLVHVSSTAVFGRERYRDEPTDESVSLPVLPAGDGYGRSKQEAERIVLDAHAGGWIWATIVRPPVMYGRRDRQFAPRVGPVLARGVFPLLGGGRTTLSVVSAESVAQGAVLASHSDLAGGRVYHLTNDQPVEVSTLVRGAATGLGRRIFAPVVPVSVGRAAFGGLGAALRLVGRGDLAVHAPGTLEMLTRDNPFTSARARTELGWNPSFDPEERLAEAFRWWKASGARGRKAS